MQSHFFTKCYFNADGIPWETSPYGKAFWERYVEHLETIRGDIPKDLQSIVFPLEIPGEKCLEFHDGGLDNIQMNHPGIPGVMMRFTLSTTIRTQTGNYEKAGLTDLQLVFRDIELLSVQDVDGRVLKTPLSELKNMVIVLAEWGVSKDKTPFFHLFLNDPRAWISEEPMSVFIQAKDIQVKRCVYTPSRKFKRPRR